MQTKTNKNQISEFLIYVCVHTNACDNTEINELCYQQVKIENTYSFTSQMSNKNCCIGKVLFQVLGPQKWAKWRHSPLSQLSLKNEKQSIHKYTKNIKISNSLKCQKIDSCSNQKKGGIGERIYNEINGTEQRAQK